MSKSGIMYKTVCVFLCASLLVQTGCYTVRTKQVRNLETLTTVVNHDQRIRIHYVNRDTKPTDAIVKSVTDKSIIVEPISLDSDTAKRYIEIPFRQIQRIEIIDKDLNIIQTVIVTVIGIAGVAAVLFILTISAVLDQYSTSFLLPIKPEKKFKEKIF